MLAAEGSTLGTALTIGDLSGRRSFRGFVGSSETNDYYRFSLSSPASVSIVLDGLSTDADLQLIRDADGNGVVDSGEVLSTSDNSGTAADSITRSLGAGTYFVRVYQFSGDTNDNLTLTADKAGNTLAAADNVGVVFAETRSFSDFVGSSDPDDFYRFSLSSPATVSVLLDGLAADADLQLIRDANNNGVVDAGEVLTSSFHDGTTAESITRSLAAGTYFVRVRPFSGDTGYDLMLS